MKITLYGKFGRDLPMRMFQYRMKKSSAKASVFRVLDIENPSRDKVVITYTPNEHAGAQELDRWIRATFQFHPKEIVLRQDSTRPSKNFRLRN